MNASARGKGLIAAVMACLVFAAAADAAPRGRRAPAGDPRAVVQERFSARRGVTETLKESVGRGEGAVAARVREALAPERPAAVPVRASKGPEMPASPIRPGKASSRPEAPAARAPIARGAGEPSTRTIAAAPEPAVSAPVQAAPAGDRGVSSPSLFSRGAGRPERTPAAPTTRAPAAARPSGEVVSPARRVVADAPSRPASGNSALNRTTPGASGAVEQSLRERLDVLNRSTSSGRSPADAPKSFADAGRAVPERRPVSVWQRDSARGSAPEAAKELPARAERPVTPAPREKAVEKRLPGETRVVTSDGAKSRSSTLPRMLRDRHVLPGERSTDLTPRVVVPQRSHSYVPSPVLHPVFVPARRRLHALPPAAQTPVLAYRGGYHDSHDRHGHHGHHRPAICYPIVARPWWTVGCPTWGWPYNGWSVGYYGRHWSIFFGGVWPGYTEYVYVPQPVYYETVVYQTASTVPVVNAYSEIDRLIDQLKYGDAETRKQAAIALGEIQSLRGLYPLIYAVEYDEDPLVRFYAARSLGRIGDRDALPVLKRVAANDPEEVVRSQAQDALDRILNR